MLSALPRLPCCTAALPALKPSPVRQPARRFFAAALAAGAIPWASVRWHQQGQRHLHTECQGNVCFNRLQIEFCGRPPKGYTPIYYADAETNTASVNAGDYNLYVGGGSINLAFAKELGLNPASNDYKQMHKALLEAAAATPGSLVRGVDVPAADSLREKLGLLGCYARVHESRPKGDLNPVGAAFLDIFGTLRPLSQKNVAMLYVVGPKGTGAPGGHGPTVDSKAQFLGAVEEMAMNALATVAAYNAEQQKEMPRVETLQVCLVSGGVYMHPDSSKKDVAKAILRGFQRGGNISDLPVVRFAYDSNCFEEMIEIDRTSQNPIGTVQNRAGHDDAAAESCSGTEESRRMHRELVSEAFQRTKGDVVIIASGGMRHGRDALDAVEAGANAVQISSLLLAEGPRACRRIKDDLAQLLMQEGHKNLESVVGAAVHRQTGRIKPKKKRNPWKHKI